MAYKATTSNLGAPNDHILLAARCSGAAGPNREIDLAISAAINFKNAFGSHQWVWSMGGDGIVSPTGGLLDPAQFVPMWTRYSDHAFLLARTCFGTTAIDFECGERHFGSKISGHARITAAHFDLPAIGATAALALCTAVFSAANDQRKLLNSRVPA